MAWREGVCERLINDYKFARTRAIDDVMATLFDERLPDIPTETVIVPIPTIAHHVRIRGYDHMDRIARLFAKRRNLQLGRHLARQTATVQHGASARVRRKQAEQAFICRDQLDDGVPYLLLDDVVTTGATVQAAADVLRAHGASEVWIATITRQPLDGKHKI